MNKFQKNIGAVVVGVIIVLMANYIWQNYSNFFDYKKALKEQLLYRDKFKSDDLQVQEIKTNSLTGSKYKTRIVFIRNFNYFDNVVWFGLAKDAKDFPNTYSAILFYDYNPSIKHYELVYKFIPLDIAKGNFLPGAEENELEQVPLLFTFADTGDLDLDGKSELVTHWSYCNFNHCVWDYPIIFSFNGGYYVSWVMPKHELTEHDLSDDYFWGGQQYEREVVNIYDDRKYKINGGNYNEYLYLDNDPKPYIVSYNIDNQTCWACDDQTYLVDIFSYDKATKAKYTFHGLSSLEEKFEVIKDFKFNGEVVNDF